MSKKNLSYITLSIVFIGAISVGIEIILSEILYPEINEFTRCPIWYQILMYVFLIIILIGLILSSFFRNKSNTSSKEIIIEGILIFLGIIGSSIGFLIVRQEYEDIVICIGGSLLFIGFFPLLSSIVGISVKDKNAPIVETAPTKVTKTNTNKKSDKTIVILSVVTVVISLILFVGGIVGDIVFWSYANAHRDPNTPGHGVPIFSIFGIGLSIFFAIFMSIIIGVVSIVKKKD